jgi:hypothetical protein
MKLFFDFLLTQPSIRRGLFLITTQNILLDPKIALSKGRGLGEGEIE